ncbi:uncharacterized protein IUM83_06266 [Phytophthora cinnamomi]|uniref:uncharacterized protein n=1 Tax=Phytophthora cinnamomi TaxID=4785 RepID=UPI002A2E82F6|nr:hypothetical protein IUM83_06266 [Phytophthora cinnamomi]KAJ8552206.1 hypothetical protein ON010_g10340 [Phytophthora cinnamomi]
MKQQKYVADFEGSIKALREEVQELILQRQLIHHGVPATSNIWSVAAEFFRLVRHRVRPSSPSNTLVSRKYNTQREFLRSTMSNDVTDGAVSGIDALLKNWALQSLCYDEIDLQPVRFEKVPRGSLVATTRGLLVINNNTLRYAFPHLVNSAQWSDLALNMLGQRLALRGSVQFEWDSASARVTSVVCKTDIMTPLLHLFGSVDVVASVFEQARLTAEGRLVSSDGLQVC